MDLAGKYSDFLSPDLIRFGQKGSDGMQTLPYYGSDSSVSSDDRWLNFFKQQLSPEARRAQLQDLLGLQKEQMKQAYPYLLSRQIPDIISQGFGLANQIRLRGGELGTAAALRGVDAVAQGRFAPYGALPEFSYFS